MVNIGNLKLVLATTTLLTAGTSVVQAKLITTADRPAIMLSPGNWQTVKGWKLMARRPCADGYRVITVDLPGRADAPLVASVVSLELYSAPGIFLP